MVIQLTLLAAVQLQLLLVVTLTLPFPPLIGKDWLVGLIVGVVLAGLFETMAVLLVAFGSGVNESTVAVFVIVLPSATEQITGAGKLAVNDAPGASELKSKVTVLPVLLQNTELELQELKVVEAGSSSVTTTEKAGSGPSLVTVMLYEMKEPGESVPVGPVMLILRSAVRLG